MNKRRVGVRAIIWYDNKLLAVRHKSKETGGAKDFWAIPGGGLDPSESLEDCLRREVYEELGIEAVPGRLLFIQQFVSTRQDYDEELEFFFLVNNYQDFIDIDYSDTSHGMEELVACEFINPVAEYVLPKFISQIDIGSYVNNPQPVLIANFLETR